MSSMYLRTDMNDDHPVTRCHTFRSVRSGSGNQKPRHAHGFLSMKVVFIDRGLKWCARWPTS